MDWFVKKGEPVRESQPTEINYNTEFLVSDGGPQSASMTIFCDEKTPTAPIHKNSNVRKLVTLEADLSQLSQAELENTIKVRKDGKE
jgi:hypothetical protein